MVHRKWHTPGRRPGFRSTGTTGSGRGGWLPYAAVDGGFDYRFELMRRGIERELKGLVGGSAVDASVFPRTRQQLRTRFTFDDAV